MLDFKKKTREYTKHSENPTAQLSSPSCSMPRFARGAVQQALIFTVLDLLRSKISQLWPFTSYNLLFQWDYTFYKWGFLSTYN